MDDMGVRNDQGGGIFEAMTEVSGYKALKGDGEGEKAQEKAQENDEVSLSMRFNRFLLLTNT